LKEQKEVDKVLSKKYIVLVRNKQQHRGRRERMIKKEKGAVK